MKKVCISLSTVLCIGILLGVNTGFAVSFLKLEREFSGKGSTDGAFGANIHVAFDAEGQIYVSDSDNRLIQKLSPNGEFLMQIPEEPQAIDNKLKKPGDIAVDENGNIYVAETTAHHIAETADPKIYMFAPCVHKFDPGGNLIYTYFVDPIDVRPKQALAASLIVDEEGKTAFGIQPKGHDRALLIAVNSQNQLFVLDAKRGRIHKFNADGEKLHVFGRYGAGNGEFDRDASDIAIDTRDNVLIADTGNHRVVKFNSGGQFILNFGVKGRNDGQFTKPIAVAPLITGEILVKDSSQYKRHLGELPSGGVLSLIPPTTAGIQDLVIQSGRSRSALLGGGFTNQSNFDALNRRIRLLEEAEYRRYFSEYFDDNEEGDKDENKKEEDEDLKAATIRATVYHNVIMRVQRFDGNGKYLGRIIYQIDKQDEENRDVAFLTLDALGNIYLRDGSDFVIRQYSVEGFSLNPSRMDGLYNARAATVDNRFSEDYEDIDPNTDIQDDITQLELSNAFLWNYNLSERWSLMFADTLVYSELDERYLTPPKAEDSYDLQTKSLSNTLAANLKFITDPNPYRYQELNVYLERIDGTSDLDQEAIFQEVNRQRQDSEGDASALSVGLNWDILSRANLWMEYANFNPADTSRNYVRRYFDVSGDLYEVFGSRNEMKKLAGELTIKF
ncbi:MAG: hypothetical protein OXN17_01560 [Candidatus Poribacteria bacterium]|nr:hypothetical protein [Candidatus Poribacteria bacterium]MDE0504335.1 hypothetical protein [Candidatus Poribacteria bacterium]